MKRWLTILSAVGISAISSSSVIACTYKSSSPVSYQKFSDLNAKNFDKLGEGKVLLYAPTPASETISPQADDQVLKQSIKEYYEGSGSSQVKNLVASSFTNYSQAVGVLSDSSMSVVIENVQSINPESESTYQVSFKIQQETAAITKKTELLNFRVASDTGVYQVLTSDNLAEIADRTEVTDDINAGDSIFRKVFVSTASFLLSLDPTDRQDLGNNGVMSLNYWVDTTNNFNSQWIGSLKSGEKSDSNPEGIICLPGVDSEGKQYRSLGAQISDSTLGVKSWRNTFAFSVATSVLGLINKGTINNSNYNQIGLYDITTLQLPANLAIANTGVTSTTSLESNQ